MGFVHKHKHCGPCILVAGIRVFYSNIKPLSVQTYKNAYILWLVECNTNGLVFGPWGSLKKKSLIPNKGSCSNNQIIAICILRWNGIVVLVKKKKRSGVQTVWQLLSWRTKPVDYSRPNPTAEHGVWAGDSGEGSKGLSVLVYYIVL